MFRLLGIKVLTGCSAGIRKVLAEGEVYLFTGEAKVTDDENTLLVHHSQVDAISALYNVKTRYGHNLSVAVNAIVGKNGDGKSSISEIIIRIVNNFAIYAGFLADHDTLRRVEGLNAILYYEADGIVYAIKSFRGQISWYKDGTVIDSIMRQGSDGEKKLLLRSTHANELFYLLFVDYSLYGMNATKMHNENNGDGCWINAIFFKNDAYQTPVVITPMREDGNIDVNREDFLSRQRLMNLFTSCDKNQPAPERIANRKVSDNVTAVGFAFSVSPKSKFIDVTIKDYFVRNRHKVCERFELKEFNSYNHPIDDNSVGMLCSFVELVARRFGDYRALVKVAREANSGWTQRGYSDIYRYIALATNFLKNKQKTNKYTQQLRGISFFKNSPRLNYTQIYRLMLVVSVWEALLKDGRFGINHSNLNEVIEHHETPRNAAILYVLYKVIDMIDTYRDLTQQWYRSDEKMNCLATGWLDESMLEQIDKDIDNIYNTHDYRTLKLWQTINYLNGEHDRYGAGDCEIKGLQNYESFVDFDKLQEILNGDRSLEKLPCPIFEGDIVLTNGHDYYTLSTLSSGMTQRLNSVGSFIYHLRNLDDEHNEPGMVNYNNVVAIFEEVELYFHPEFQKSYLDYMLKQIANSSIHRIQNLQIIFVTHSPFILSDVLKQNMLSIKDGHADIPANLSTFGANIHNILRHPFFMEKGTIGDYAQNVITRIVIALKVQDCLRNHPAMPLPEYIDKEQIGGYMRLVGLDYVETGLPQFCESYSRKNLLAMIEILDEPIVKQSLMAEYLRIFNDEDARQRRIRELQAELDLLKN